MFKPSPILLARIRSSMGHSLPVTSRDEIPIIKFPSAFANLKKVKKGLRYENSLFIKQFTDVDSSIKTHLGLLAMGNSRVASRLDSRRVAEL